MKISAIEVKEHKFKKKVRGYDPHDVNAFKELVAESFEEAAKYINDMEEKNRMLQVKLAEHEGREKILRETITTAQKMVEDFKNNAKKEAELIISEARIKADDIVKRGHEKVLKLQDDIQQMKKQKMEIQTSIKAILNYHNSMLLMEEQEAAKEDAADDKLKFFRK